MFTKGPGRALRIRRKRHACLVGLSVHSMPDAKEKSAGGGLAKSFALGSGGQVEEAL